MAQLFTREQAPRFRKPPIKRMHVIDAGPSERGEGSMVMMKCRRCRYESGWLHVDKSITEIKRGFPCPNCNDIARSDGVQK